MPYKIFTLRGHVVAHDVDFLRARQACAVNIHRSKIMFSHTKNDMHCIVSLLCGEPLTACPQDQARGIIPCNFVFTLVRCMRAGARTVHHPV
jgi:hypothetical protein